MKLKVLILSMCLSAAVLSGCGMTEEFSNALDEQKQLIEEEKEKQEENINSMLAGEDDPAEEFKNETEKPQAESLEQEAEQESEPQEDSKKEIASGAHEIAGADFFFSRSVNNDVTGKWRISTVNTSMSTEEYAADYYKELFSSDEEIHGVVNFALNTTSRITVLDPKTLDVTILEYVDGEEHDAKELFSGMVLAEYTVDIETGQASRLDEN